MHLLSKLKAISWGLRTSLTKSYILLQDRLGLYGYQDWIGDNEPSPQELAQQVHLSGDFAYQPVISLLVRTGGLDVQHVVSTCESLAKQTYPNWEACLVSLTDENLEWGTASFTDRRLRSQKIAGSSWNAAVWAELLAMAEGEYVQVVNAGDLLSPESIYEVVNQLNSIPQVDILYSDEDRLSRTNRERAQPFFKPDWSPELLLSINYLCHAVFRLDLLLEALEKPFPENFSDDDLFLRCSELAQHILHIPQVLYHRFDSGAARDSSADMNPYCASVAAHLARCGVVGATAAVNRNGNIRVIWPDSKALVSIIIPTKDNVDYLRNCLDSIREHTTYSNYEIVLVDNGSTDQDTFRYYENLRSIPDILRVDFHGPFNFNKVLNLGAHHARGEILLFLNNDTEIIDSDWLGELARWADRPEIGIVGAKLIYPDATIQHAGIIVGMEGHGSHIFTGVHENYHGIFGSIDWYRNYSAVTGACMAIRREVFDEIGRLDEDYELVFSDIEICLRVIDAGYRVVYNPFARLIHHEGKTRRRHISAHDIGIAYEHLKTIVAQGDPFYNPNLSYSVRIPTYKRAYEESPIERLESIVRQKANS